MRWSGLRLSVTLLTVIPLRGPAAEPRRATVAAAMAWAPAVGLLLGVIAAAVLVVGRPSARRRPADRRGPGGGRARAPHPGTAPGRPGRPGRRPGQRPARGHGAGHHAPLGHRAVRHRDARPDLGHPGRGARPRRGRRGRPGTRGADRRGGHRQAGPHLGLPPGGGRGPASGARRAGGRDGPPCRGGGDHAGRAAAGGGFRGGVGYCGLRCRWPSWRAWPPRSSCSGTRCAGWAASQATCSAR